MDDFFAAMRLSALLDNTLDDEEKAQVELAIQESPRLRVQYSRMMTAVELVRSQGNADPPAILEQKILDRLRSDGMLRAPWSEQLPQKRTLLATAALVGGLGLSWLTWPRTPEISAPPLPEEDKNNPTPAAQLEISESPVLPTAPPEVVGMKPRPTPQKKRIKASSPPPAKSKASPPPAKSKASPTTPKSEAIVTPIPRWEENGQETPTALVEPPSELTRLRLYPTQTNALYELEQWAKSAGVSLNIPPRTLSSEDNYARLELTVAGAGITDLLDTLQRLGPLHQVNPPSAHLDEDAQHPVEIEIQYQP